MRASTRRLSRRADLTRRRPTGGIAGALLFFFLNLNPRPRTSVREQLRVFDFAGLALIVGGVACVLVGFNRSQTSCACGVYAVAVC